MSNSDTTKWADQYYLLLKHTEGVCSALLAFKKQIDFENHDSDRLYRGGSATIAYTYRGTPFSPECPSRPAVQKINALSVPEVVAASKFIIKKFPEPPSLKVRTIIRACIHVRQRRL
jgi:hypothetical protein